MSCWRCWAVGEDRKRHASQTVGAESCPREWKARAWKCSEDSFCRKVDREGRRAKWAVEEAKGKSYGWKRAGWSSVTRGIKQKIRRKRQRTWKSADSAKTISGKSYFWEGSSTESFTYRTRKLQGLSGSLTGFRSEWNKNGIHTSGATTDCWV